MRKVISYLRINEWLASKVIMMLGVFSYFLYMNEILGLSALIGIGVYFLYVSSFLAISYIANDYSDIEVDKKAGKEKVISKLKTWQIWLSFVLIFIMGNLPLLVYCENKVLVGIFVVVTYILGLSYSTLGIRFKEKGIWGLIECSFAQKCAPLVVIYAMISFNKIQLLMLVGWMIVSFLDGLRYIIIHQVVDLENDLKSGVVTYVMQKKKNYRKLLATLFIFDIVGTFLILLPITCEHIVLSLIVVLLFALLEFGIYKVLNVFAKKDWFCTFDSVPFEAFLNCGMPLLIGVCLAMSNYYIWAYIVLLVLVSFKPICIKFDIAKIFYLQSVRKDN